MMGEQFGRSSSYDDERTMPETGQARESDDWSMISQRFRDEWQKRHGQSGGRWEEVEPGYRYGYEMGNDTRYQGRDWPEIESEFRQGYSGWARQRGYQEDDNAWDRLKDSIRDAWDNVRGHGRR